MLSSAPLRVLRTRGSRRRKKPRSGSYRPQLEELEDRTLMSGMVSSRDIVPSSPTTDDAIAARIRGTFPSPRQGLSGPASVRVTGTNVAIDLFARTLPPHIITILPVVPFEVTATIGMLAAGSYTDTIRLFLDDRVISTLNGSFRVQMPPVALPTDVHPNAGTHAAPVGTHVSASYEQPVIPTSVTPSTFVVHAAQRGRLLPLGSTLAVSGSTVQLTPGQPFRPGELVQVTATNRIQRTGSTIPTGPYVWQFTTAVSGGTGRFVSSGQVFPGAHSTDVAVGDLDRDGDLDAFVTGPNAVWLNNGTGQFTDIGQRLGGSGEAVELGDLDGDGDLDAFVTKRGPSEVWLNDGRGQFADSGQRLGTANSAAVALGDVDGDGDLDAFVAKFSQFSGSGPPSEVWLNDGQGQFTDSGQRLGNGQSFGVALGDLDGDGDLDAFLANSVLSGGPPSQVWLNDGRGRFADSGQRLGGSNSVGVVLGDVDGDGDLDAFVANLGQANRVWFNNGRGSFTAGPDLGRECSSPSLDCLASRDVALGDLDGDGDLDAFLAAGGLPGQPDEVWLNNGQGQFTDSGQRLGGNLEGFAVALGDLDGDGDLDAFVANHGNDPAQPNQVWLNVDQGGRPHVFISDASIRETDAGLAAVAFTVTLSAPATEPVTVRYATADGTAIAGPDYQAASGQLTIARGETSGRIVIQVIGDGIVERDETFLVNLSDAVGVTLADSQAVGTIINDDLPSITIDDISVNEGNQGSTAFDITVRLSQPTHQTVTVNYRTVNGTATNLFPNPDYPGTSGMITFRPDDPEPTVQRIRLFVNGDTIVEPDETFAVLLSDQTNAHLQDNEGVVTIVNDDRVPLVRINDVRLPEGNEGTSFMDFTVTLSEPSPQTVILSYRVTDGTATAGSDYFLPLGFVNITPGDLTGMIRVVIQGDRLLEPDETFFVNLTVVGGGAILEDGQGVGTILNDDGMPPPPLPALTIENAMPVLEGDSGTRPASFSVGLSRPPSERVTVRYATADGSATAGSDYIATSGELVFEPGETTTKRVLVPVRGDTVPEGNETFFVILSDARGAAIARDRAFASILNDDGGLPPPLPSLTIENAPPVLEGDSGTRPASFTVRVSRPPSERVTVRYATMDGSATAGSDYTPASGQLVFEPESSAPQTILVHVRGDTMVEPDEAFFLILSDVRGASLTSDRASGTILNDDRSVPPPAVLDLVPRSLAWNVRDGGVSLTYQIVGGDLPRPTTLALYWAAGDRIVDDQPAYTGPTQVRAGSYSLPIAAADLVRNPPRGANRLLAVLDPGPGRGMVDELNDDNNTIGIPYQASVEVTPKYDGNPDRGTIGRFFSVPGVLRDQDLEIILSEPLAALRPSVAVEAGSRTLAATPKRNLLGSWDGRTFATEAFDPGTFTTDTPLRAVGLRRGERILEEVPAVLDVEPVPAWLSGLPDFAPRFVPTIATPTGTYVFDATAIRLVSSDLTIPRSVPLLGGLRSGADARFGFRIRAPLDVRANASVGGFVGAKLVLLDQVLFEKELDPSIGSFRMRAESELNPRTLEPIGAFGVTFEYSDGGTLRERTFLRRIVPVSILLVEFALKGDIRYDVSAAARLSWNPAAQRFALVPGLSFINLGVEADIKGVANAGWFLPTNGTLGDVLRRIIDFLQALDLLDSSEQQLPQLVWSTSLVGTFRLDTRVEYSGDLRSVVPAVVSFRGLFDARIESELRFTIGGRKIIGRDLFDLPLFPDTLPYTFGTFER